MLQQPWIEAQSGATEKQILPHVGHHSICLSPGSVGQWAIGNRDGDATILNLSMRHLNGPKPCVAANGD